MENKYTISNHAKQRYAERIMGKDETIEINRFINLNEDKIKTDINKMIVYGEKIYTGIQAGQRNKNPVDVYLKDCWVVLADARSFNVITLYKIDLGIDDEFNKLYISKMKDKLETAKAHAAKVAEDVEIDNYNYKQTIEDAETDIKNYKTMIKNLEEMCAGYTAIINSNVVKITQANLEVAEILNTLIGKKEF